ncbi:uncharacterized protein L969DRAFT_92474 [Mixia osmundae IAM 14324]|uniref:Lipoyl-binding domain-containing protein n=1 Tax=Mixia osmundae (strain CBS 9802 / IAM 14324 / JCM 22182 / KY 12970) TaxID=764103 RepID=G7DXF6_MIXOS|nr:uncharacterized protein L969DRAFT_92474 [Mixia osmundae IAM 14324]KEI41240.1 hypothetical protein L969DRAFT_92474 [Mixia osmundae IAM 14324]GAA95266.1 hypothetical protein E5Q_01922 [Mixia osmundae IAM 14324]
MKRSMLALRRCTCTRTFHSSPYRRAITELKMPSMSPTMEQGSISSWKVKEGDKFSAGDVLLSIETDKAEVDVEAQDDGIMGKILSQDGASGIVVGKTIALTAEEGDDISNLEAPKDDAPTKSETKSSHNQSKEDVSTSEQDKGSSSATDANKNTSADHHKTSPESSNDSHSQIIKSERPLGPSVMRLLIEAGITDSTPIKATGNKGLTKGDVLAYLGKIKDPLGSLSRAHERPLDVPGKETSKSVKAPAKNLPPPDGPTLRRLITLGLTQPAWQQSVIRDVPARSAVDVFDDIVSDYLPASTPALSTSPTKSARASDPWLEILS